MRCKCSGPQIATSNTFLLGIYFSIYLGSLSQGVVLPKSCRTHWPSPIICHLCRSPEHLLENLSTNSSPFSSPQNWGGTMQVAPCRLGWHHAGAGSPPAWSPPTTHLPGSLLRTGGKHTREGEGCFSRLVAHWQMPPVKWTGLGFCRRVSGSINTLPKASGVNFIEMVLASFHLLLQFSPMHFKGSLGFLDPVRK